MMAQARPTLPGNGKGVPALALMGKVIRSMSDTASNGLGEVGEDLRAFLSYGEYYPPYTTDPLMNYDINLWTAYLPVIRQLQIKQEQTAALALRAKLQNDMGLSGLHDTDDTPETNWWQALVADTVGTQNKILYEQNMAKGVYTQVGPGGTIKYVQPGGNNSNVFNSTQTGVTGGITGSASGSLNTNTLLLVGAVGIGIVMLMNKGR